MTDSIQPNSALWWLPGPTTVKLAPSLSNVDSDARSGAERRAAASEPTTYHSARTRR